MGAAERRKKVIQGGLVREIQGSKSYNRADAFCMEQVVGSNADVKRLPAKAGRFLCD